MQCSNSTPVFGLVVTKKTREFAHRVIVHQNVRIREFSSLFVTTSLKTGQEGACGNSLFSTTIWLLWYLYESMTSNNGLSSQNLQEISESLRHRLSYGSYMEATILQTPVTVYTCKIKREASACVLACVGSGWVHGVQFSWSQGSRWYQRVR